MKKVNNLMIIFFILLLIFGFLFFLIKKQDQNYFRMKDLPKVLKNQKDLQNNNQVNQDAQFNIDKPKIQKIEPVSQGLTLEITEPKENAIYNTSTIKVFGKTSANAEVYVNDIQTKADSSGNFSVNYNLDEGENLLTVVANDSVGNYEEKEMMVYLQTQE